MAPRSPPESSTPRKRTSPTGTWGLLPQPQLIVTFVDGNPYGTSHVDAQGNNPIGEQTRNAARHQAERVVLLTSAFKAGLRRLIPPGRTRPERR